ncbi:MAG TPA: hypothetical protein VHM19_05655 [Polyangiales bacterium]|nr:hypothetical protein [Polyangiales bacterium]
MTKNPPAPRVLVVSLATACALVATLPGCSTATAAGCGAGTLAGIGVAALALAGSDNSGVDGGAVVLGGGIFGVVAGCTGAAVAEAVATSDEGRRRERSRDRERDFESQAAPAPTQLRESRDAQGQRHLSARFYASRTIFALDAIPAHGPEVALEITQSSSAGRQTCDSVIVVDGHTLDTQVRGRGMQGVTLALDFAAVQTMALGRSVSGRTCGHEWSLSSDQRAVLGSFVDRLLQIAALDGVKPVPAAAPAAAPTAPDSIPAPALAPTDFGASPVAPAPAPSTTPPAH